MKFRKKPVVIDAVQTPEKGSMTPVHVLEFIAEGNRDCKFNDDGTLDIFTLEGVMKAQPLDWIIRGANGEHYPCKPDIFEKTYELVGT